MKLLAFASLLALTAAVGCSSASEGTGSSEDFATSDIDRMFRRPDGTFDVVCTNGTSEQGVTAERLRSNQLCGGGPAPAPVPTPSPTTSTELVFRNVARTLARAQFGIDHGPDGDTFHIETHEGGDPKCPDSTTPSPNRTMIVKGVKQVAAGTKLTEADGVSASFLDFTGDQINDLPFVKATAITVTVVAITDASIELEVEATFGTEGTAKGRIAAAFCQSLSE